MTTAKIQALLAQATGAQRAGRGQEAAGYFEAVLKIDPRQPVALNSLGVQALAEGRVAQAVALARRATEADPGEPVLWINLARAEREAGDVAGERRALDAALERDPRQFMALLRKAQLLERLDEVGNATRIWSAALAMAPPADRVPPALAGDLAHGRDYVLRQGQALGQEVDAAMAGLRATIDGAERRRFDACIDATLGRRRIYQPECAGLYYPFLPADEYFARDHFPWMPALEARTAAIRGELEQLIRDPETGFVPYVSQPANTPDNPWSALNDRLDWSAYYLWRMGVRQDHAAAACPETAAAIAQVPLLDIPDRGPTVFFSILKPHTRIPPHSGVTNSRAIVHLPLIVPDGCRFRVGGETRPWEEGRAFAFDDTIEHEAWNDSDRMRAVLILDVWNPHLSVAEQTMLREYFRVIDASHHKPDLPAGL